MRRSCPLVKRAKGHVWPACPLCASMKGHHRRGCPSSACGNGQAALTCPFPSRALSLLLKLHHCRGDTGDAVLPRRGACPCRARGSRRHPRERRRGRRARTVHCWRHAVPNDSRGETACTTSTSPAVSAGASLPPWASIPSTVPVASAGLPCLSQRPRSSTSRACGRQGAALQVDARRKHEHGNAGPAARASPCSCTTAAACAASATTAHCIQGCTTTASLRDRSRSARLSGGRRPASSAKRRPGGRARAGAARTAVRAVPAGAPCRAARCRRKPLVRCPRRAVRTILASEGRSPSRSAGAARARRVWRY